MKEFIINIQWSTEDFTDIAPNATLEQKKAALGIVKDSHDASLGVSWESLEQAMQLVLEATPAEVKAWANSDRLEEVK